MAVLPFSAKRLQALIETLESGTVGLDTLRDTATGARSILSEVEDPARVVLAWVLVKQLDAVCDRYDGEPMTVEDSTWVTSILRSTVREALQSLLGRGRLDDTKAVEQAYRVLTASRDSTN